LAGLVGREPIAGDGGFGAGAATYLARRAWTERTPEAPKARLGHDLRYLWCSVSVPLNDCNGHRKSLIIS
jgi:hypothetical protein